MELNIQKVTVYGVEQKNLHISDCGKLFKINKHSSELEQIEAYDPDPCQKYLTYGIKKPNGKQGKTTVHRMVKETFHGYATEDLNWETLCPDCFSLDQWMSFTIEQREFISHGIHIDHIDGNKFNNNLSNLRYLWAKDNVKKGNKSE